MKSNKLIERRILRNPHFHWQYIIIFVSLIFLGINALPNFYGNNDVLALSSESSGLPLVEISQIEKRLTEYGIEIKKIGRVGNARYIYLKSQDDVEVARQNLSAFFGNAHQVKVINESTVPEWLNNLGAKPIKLGLDLSGGVLFVLDVDSNKAFKERLVYVENYLKSLLRDIGIRNSQVSVDKHARVKLLLKKRVELNGLVQELRKQFPKLQINYKNSRAISFYYDKKSRQEFHQQIMSQSLTTLRARVEQLGITEAAIQRQGENKIRIELPGVNNAAEARAIIGATAALDFYELKKYGGQIVESTDGHYISINPLAIFSGSRIKDAQAGVDEMGRPLVNLTLDKIGGDKMLRFSSENIGNQLITVLSEYYKNSKGEVVENNKVISNATIQSPLSMRFSITNLGSLQGAHELAMLLRAGSLSAPITIVQESNISASLGESNSKNGIAALILGICMTLLFMGIWYRKLGLIANCSLLLNLMCLIGLMSLLPGVVLTLPGIAGLVLTVGMAVDTNVLIFERIKEELLLKRGFLIAVRNGYDNALTTIMDSNITTLLTGGILYSVGYGPVRGFAVTLCLGILTSMFTGLFVSKVLINTFLSNNLFESKVRGSRL